MTPGTSREETEPRGFLLSEQAFLDGLIPAPRAPDSGCRRFVKALDIAKGGPVSVDHVGKEWNKDEDRLLAVLYCLDLGLSLGIPAVLPVTVIRAPEVA